MDRPFALSAYLIEGSHWIAIQSVFSLARGASTEQYLIQLILAVSADGRQKSFVSKTTKLTMLSRSQVYTSASAFLHFQ